MHNALKYILEEYPSAAKEGHKDHPLARFIRKQASADLKKALGPQGQGLDFEGHPGNGKWTDTPWLGIMDPLVTKTPQDGYYVAYITSTSMDRVVLSLQLGTESIKNELGKKAAYARLEYLTALIQDRLSEYPTYFSNIPIDLQPPSPASRAASYEKGHAFGKTYFAPLPSDDVLRQDLHHMVHLYKQLTFRGGIGEVENADGPEITASQDYTGDENKRRFQYHKRIERNKKLACVAKRIHGHICQACGFDFAVTYGPLGSQYIEAHHLMPLSHLADNSSVLLDARQDFAVVCANCHRMIHRNGAPETFAEFQKLLRDRRENHVWHVPARLNSEKEKL